MPSNTFLDTFNTRVISTMAGGIRGRVVNYRWVEDPKDIECGVEYLTLVDTNNVIHNFTRYTAPCILWSWTRVK
jgi:hypothetical protein